MGYIWTVIGQQGAGKTYFLALMALEEPDFRDRFKFSNCWIDTDYKTIEWEDLKDIPKNSILLFDELAFWVEVRISGYWFNTFLTRFFNTARKRDVDIFSTYQLGRMVDVRILEQTRYLVKCGRVDNGSGDRDTWDFKWVIMDLFEDKIIPFELTYQDAKPLFERFQSYELPESIHDQEDDWRLAKLNPKKMKETIYEAVDTIGDTLTEITHSSVKLALRLHGYSESMERDVYAILKNQVKIRKSE